MATKDKNTDSGPDDWQSSGVDDWQAKPGNASDARALSFMPKNPGFIRDILNGDLAVGDTLTGGNIKNKTWRDAIQMGKEESPNSTMIGRGVGNIGLGAATMAIPGGFPARVMAGGALGAYESPGDNLSLADEIKARSDNFARGAGITAGLGAVGSGLSKLGDWGMQRAVGMKSYIPGMGNRIADEGLIGTKGMMKAQIDGAENPSIIDRALEKLGITNKMNAREAEINAVLPKVKGTVRSADLESPVSKMGADLVPKNPNLPIDPRNMPFVNAAEERAKYIVNRGDLDPVDALDVFRKSDKAAYDPGISMERFQRGMAKAETGAGRESLKNLADQQGLPGLRNNLSSEQALINAREGLTREEPVLETLVKHGRRGLIGGGIGAAFGHGYPGMVAGAAGAEVASSAPFLSTLGQLGTQGAKPIPYLTPAAIDAMIKKSMGNDINDWESKK